MRRTLELCFEKDARKRIADMRDVKLALAGAFAPGDAGARHHSGGARCRLPRRSLVGLLLASVYFLGSRPPAARR